MLRTTMSLVVLAAVAATGCRHHANAEEGEKEAHYQVTTPMRQDTELAKEYVAQIRAIQHIEVRALEKGYLQSVYVDEGQAVTKGQRLFQLLPAIYQAEVQKAQAEADLSEIELNNTKLLADKNVVSPNELSLVNAKFNKAKAEVALASTHKSMTDLRAPFNGIVGRFHARRGSLVAEGDLLTTLSDNSTVWVYFNVSEAEYLQYKATHEKNDPTEVKLVMANGAVFEHPGKVETIEADFNNETGNLAFRAAFPNPKGLLRHGETGKVVMTESVKNALLIPQKATFDVLDKKYVFVVDDKNIVHSKLITVSAELPHVYIVANGLDDKDKVLLEGLRKVRDGVAIAPDFKPPREAFQHLDVPAE